MCKPLTDEELWGDPDAVQAADQDIEELLGYEEIDGDNFDDAHSCPECGEPRHLCTCKTPGFSVAPEVDNED